MRVMLFVLLTAGVVSMAVGLFAPGRSLRWTVVPGLAAVVIAAIRLTTFGATTGGLVVTALACFAAAISVFVARPSSSAA